MIDDSQKLGIFLKTEASRTGAQLSYDTHYDAQNWQLSWWRGATLHRLDFQPLEDGKLAVTHYRDHFRFFPRLLQWAHNAIPMFPYVARIEWDSLAMEHFPFQEEQIATIISYSVNA